MTEGKVIHPNFRTGPGQKNPAKRTRSLMFTCTQDAFDAIMTEVALSRAASSHEVIARAVESYLRLVPGSATPKASDSD